MIKISLGSPLSGDGGYLFCWTILAEPDVKYAWMPLGNTKTQALE